VSNRLGIPWARIAAEFVVIVLGVTAALLADEWRQARQDRALEADLLKRLIEDVSWDLQELDTVDWSSDEAAGAASGLLASIDDPLRHLVMAINPSRALDIDSPSTDPGLALWTAIAMRRFDHRRVTYDEMISTGGIGVLRNSALRSEISRYYALVGSLERFLIERPGSDALTEALNDIGLSVGGDIRWIEDLLVRLKQVPNVEFLLRDQVYRTGQRTNFSRMIRAAANDLLRDLREECGPRCGAS